MSKMYSEEEVAALLQKARQSGQGGQGMGGKGMPGGQKESWHLQVEQYPVVTSEVSPAFWVVFALVAAECLYLFFGG